MSRNEDFDNGIWSDPEFEELSAPAAWLYIWSWTNPRCDMAGIYKVGKRAMTESRVGLDDLDYALAELSAAHFAYYERGVLWVRSRVKRLRSKSPRMAISVARDFAKIPAGHPLHERWLEMYGDHAWLRAALADVLGNLTDTSGEVHERPDTKGNFENLIGTSKEVPMDGNMEGDEGRRRSSTGKVPPRASGRVDQLVPPRELGERFPAVAGRLDEVLGILVAVQVERGGHMPTPRGVGLAMLRHPDRDHLAVAHDLEHWAVAGRGQNEPVKDWAGTYRTFLRRAPAGAPSRRTSGTGSPRGGVDDLIEQVRQRGRQQADVIEGREAA